MPIGRANRRAFLERCVLGSVGMMCSPMLLGNTNSSTTPPAHLCLSLTANGGWDVTSFCDPKENVAGQPLINHWSQEGMTPQSVSGTDIQFAPWGNNQAFFERFAESMLVLNGIDSQTNAHFAAERSMWSGQLGHGYPSIGALLISSQSQTQYPLGYLSNGGYRETAGLAPYTQIDNPETLRNLVRIRASEWGSEPLIAQAEYDLIKQAQTARFNRLRTGDSMASLSFREVASFKALTRARASEHLMEQLDSLLPESSAQTDIQGLDNALIRQIDLVLAAYRAGLCITGSLVLNGFDTHSEHDAQHELLFQRLTNGITYLFDQAALFGIEEQIKLVVGSEFARTPMYNSDNGKDHWPIGSALFIQKGASWGGRVVGITDEFHNSILIDPQTLQASTRGIQLQTRHFQSAVRQFFGVSDPTLLAQFPLEYDGINILS